MIYIRMRKNNEIILKPSTEWLRESHHVARGETQSREEMRQGVLGELGGARICITSSLDSC